MLKERQVLRYATLRSMRTDLHCRRAVVFAIAIAVFLSLSRATYAATGDNLALGKPVAMGGGDSLDPTQKGANCTDGVTAGNYPTNTICRTLGLQTGTNREWIEVDLGQDYVIDRVRLSNRTDGTNGDFARWIVITTRPSALAGVTSNPQSTLDKAVNPDAAFVNKLAYAAGIGVGTSYGTAQNVAWTTLDLKVGTHIARYVRIYSMKPAPTALNLAEIEIFEGPPPVRTITNGSFELPAIPAGSFRQVAETHVPGWSTTEPVPLPDAGYGTAFVDGGDIEMWGNGFQGVAADNGATFVELDAYSDAALSPTPLCVYPGETFQWRASHRARGGAAQVDVARLRISGQNIASFSDGTTQAGTHTCAPDPGFNCTPQTGSPTATGWGRWQGNWTNLLAQPVTMTLEFAAISSTSPAFGNFMDNVSISGLTAAVEFGGNTTGLETTPTASLPLLLVNGSVTVAQTIKLDITGGSATRGVDYTTTPATGPITVTIPVGTYDGTSATAISLAPYIQVSSDYVVEGSETIDFGISNATAGLSIAGASGCRAGVSASTYTITDVLLPRLNVTKSATPATFGIGQPASYAITVLNDGNAPTSGNITLSDTLPSGIALASAVGTNWSCTGTTTLTCTFTGTLAAGNSTTLTLNVNVSIGSVAAGGNNSATARGGGDPGCPASGTTATRCTGTVSVAVTSSYVCSPSTIFVAQSATTQLDAATFVSGSLVFTPTGGPSPWTYNAIAYRGSDDFIYAISQNRDASHPQNHLLLVDPATGAVADLGAITGGLTPAGGVNVGTFDGSGNLLVANGSENHFFRVNLTTRVATLVNVAPLQALGLADFTFANGFLWGIDGSVNPATMARIDPVTGAITRFNLPAAVVPTGTGFGAAWTFGNGNLGFSDNATGNVYQLRVTNPSGTPTFTRVGLSSGPSSTSNDGTSCVSPPVDLSITKSGPASFVPGGAISWTLTVTNNGPLTSSGYTVTDTVPAGVTGVSSPTAGCSVASNVVTCVGGTLANGASATFTINGIAPPAPAAVTHVVPFSFTGADQSFTVPPGVGSISVKLWGAGAGGSNSAGFYSTGGAGGYVSGDITVVPGTVYSIVAGEGGWSDGNTNWNTRPYGFGGKAISQSFGSDGGGLSGIFAGGTPVLTSDSARAVVVAGGGGGGEMGTSFGVSVGGQGGDPAHDGGMGTMTGGDNTTSPAGGGGGGGGYAGGVTNRTRLRYPAAATVTMGEGGASFIAAGVMNGSNLFSPDHVSPFTTIGNSIPPNTGDAQYVAGIGVGTYVTFGKGGDGRVVIQYDTPPVPLTPLANVATVQGNESDPVSGNDTATETVNPITPPNVTISKSLTAESGTIAGQAEPGEQLTYTITLTNSGGVAATSYSVKDTLDPNVSFVSANNGGTFAAGDVTWNGLTVPANGSLSLTLVVQVAASIPPGTSRIGNAARQTGQPQPNCTVLPTPANCTAIPMVPQFRIDKVAGAPASTGVANEYRITYVATVTNGGGSAGNYDLSDTLTFNGATVTAISAPAYSSTTGDTQTGTLGAFAPTTGGTIVSSEPLAPLGVERWSYTVTYQITNAAVATDCSAPAGGLRNSAALSGGVTGVPPAKTCSGAPNISIVKLAATPVATGNPNQFTLTFTVDVTNSGTLSGMYDLSDAINFNGATVNAISAPVYSSTTGDTQTGTLGTLTPPAGGTIVTDEPIAAGGKERWVYIVTYTVTNAAVAQNCTVASGGLRNHAALGGSLNGQSNSCTGAPAVIVGKSVSGPLPTGNLNEYRVSYLVLVRNDGSLAGSYSLSDTFTFPGVSGVAVTAVTHGGPDALATALGTLTSSGGTIVTGESIAAGASETYSYDVVFTVANVATVGTCNASGGLTNRAALGGSSSGFVSTCSDVPNITVVKTPIVFNGTGATDQYVITYNVVVTNTGRAAGVYTLSDAFNFAGATINAVSAVTHGGIDPLSTTVGTLTNSGGTIVSAEPIAANGSESYLYSVTLTLNNAALANNCALPGGGLRNTATLGGSIAGSNSSCSGVPIVTVTKALTSESGSLPGVAEPGETLTYTLTLSNSGTVAATGYSVKDQLDPNTSFLSANGGGVYTAGVVTWTGIAVAAGGTTSVTVTVIVNAPIAGGVTQLANVAYQAGTTPPACPPASPRCVVTPTASTVLVSKALTNENGTQSGIAEPGEQLTYTITLTNVGGSTATGFSVTDQLDPNVSFVSASNGGTFSAGAVNWTGLTVPASGNLQVTVVVSVNTPIPAGVTRIGNVAFETGTVPPSCPPASTQCTIMPTASQVTVTKALAGENGTQAGIAEPGEQLTYTITLTNIGGSTASGYGASDKLDPLTSFVSADNGGALTAGEVRWTGLTIAPGSSLVLTAVVQVANPIPAGVTSIANVAYKTGGTLPSCPPASSQCAVTPTAAQIRITKSGGSPVPTGTPNQFRITYVATASNTGGSTANYTLTDALTFNGATINTISTPVYATSTADTQTGTPGSFGLPSGGTIVSGEGLTSLGVETWTYTVTYTVTNAALAAACANPAGGLRNSAAITGGGTAPTCSGAANVDLLKTASTPVPTGSPNQFTIDYQVLVRNTGTLAGVYSLTDTISFNGATVNAISTPVYSSTSGDTRGGALGTFAAPSGGTIVSGETIGIAGDETWRYTVTYTITNSTLAQNCASPAGGLRNRAELGGSFNGESASCTGAPAVVIGKTASGPVPTGNPNEYSILYLVTVHNNGTLSGTYNLADTFTLPGTSGVSVSAVSHSGSDPLATSMGALTTSGGTIVTGESIAAGASENYTYSLTFTVADTVALGRCSIGGGGLRNLAALGGSSSGQVDTCSDVPNISVVKSAGTPFPTGTPNQFSIAYTVDVVNSGAAAGAYDLADTFAFAGATINAVSAVAHSGNDPLSTSLGTLTATGGTIVDDEPINPGLAERYTYGVTYTLTNPSLAADCVNQNNGLRNNAALGGSASGSATTCSGAADVGLLKTASVPVPTGSPNQFTLTYTVKVQNLGSIAGSYNLSDALTFNGATVNSVTAPAFSSPSGDPRTGALGAFGAPGGGVIVSGEPVTAGGTEIWMYTVTYTVTNPSTAQACGSPSGGLRNRASLEGSFIGQSTICTGAPAVVIGKSASGPAPTGTPNEFTIDYLIDVQNNGTLSGTYDLSDAFTLPGVTGVTVSTVVHAGSDPLTATLGTLTSSGGTIVSGESIAAGASETYAYSIRFTVADATAVGTCAGGGGLRNLASLGGSSSGQVATCSGVPHVSIIKTLTSESGSQAGLAEPGEQLTYTITLSNTGGSTATSYAVSDRLDPLTSFVSASNGGVPVSGEVRWSGLTIPAGSNLVLTAVVQVANPIPAGVSNISDVAYRTGSTPPSCPPASNQCVTTPTAGQIGITKTGGSPVPTGTPNQFRITYVATIANTGGGTGTYTLTDALTFNGATINAISTPVYATSTGDPQTGTPGPFGLPAGGTIVTGEGLAPLGRETWTYTVTYTITNAALASSCANPAGGLRNSAAVGGGSTATTCSGAANVDVLKTASTPVATGSPNQFSIDYQVQVRNIGTLAGVYSLTDTLSFNGATVNTVGTPIYSSTTGDVRDGALGTFAPPNGGTIVSGETILVGGEETWRYTVTYTITNASLAQNCASPAGGLRNRAELGGSFNGESANCTGAPAVVIGKSASGPIPTGNPNQYSILYLLTVHNNGSLAGTYDLSDTFTLPGTSGVSVSVVSHGGSDPLATSMGTLTPAGGTIVSGESIAAGASENYTYRLTFTVANTAAVGKCISSGGLRNLAALGGSSSGQVATCSDVPNITILKSAGTPFSTGTPNQFSIAYAIDVANNGAAAGTYDLADTFAFAGATINAVTAVAHSGNDPLSTSLGTLTAAGGAIVDDETINPGLAERYTYGVTYTLNNPALAADCVSPTGGLRNAAALGGSVTGTASTCAGAANVVLFKSASVPAPTGTPNQFTIIYTVNVRNLGSIAGVYDLADALTFNGATVDSVTAPAFSSPSGDSRTGVLGAFAAPAGGTIVSAEPITAGGVEIWSYTVTYTVTNAATAQNCTSPTGGLRNRALLGGSFNGQSTICTGAPAVVIGKSASGPTPTGIPNEFTIDYLVDVQNDGTLSGTYNLSDAFTLPGVSSVAVSAVVHAGSDPLATTLGTLTSSGGTIVTAESIAAGASETYAYSIRFTVANAAVVGTCAGGAGLRNLASLGGSSSGQVATCSGVPNVTIVKTLASESGSQSGLAEPGETLTYNITLTNSGSAVATNYGVRDPLDPNVSLVSVNNGGVLNGGAVTWSGLTIAPSTSVILTIAVKVAVSLGPTVTKITNLAHQTGTVPPNCTIVPAPQGCVVLTVAQPPLLSITKVVIMGTDDPGGTVVYAVTVRNVGTGAAVNAVINDPIPNGMVAFAWTCAGNGVSCPNASGTGAISQTVPNLPPGAALVYTITATVSQDPPQFITNTANVTPPGLGVCAPGNTPAPCQASAIVEVPALSHLALILMGFFLLAIAWKTSGSQS